MINLRFEDDPKQHVCEIQLVHAQLMSVREGGGAHKVYGVFRYALEMLELQGVDLPTLDQDNSTVSVGVTKHLEQRVCELEQQVKALLESHARLEATVLRLKRREHLQQVFEMAYAHPEDLSA
jgi:hypothetical protein